MNINMTSATSLQPTYYQSKNQTSTKSVPRFWLLGLLLVFSSYITGSAEGCSCAPTSYTFTFDFTGTDVVNVHEIDILELGWVVRTNRLMTDKNQTWKHGDSFVFTSYMSSISVNQVMDDFPRYLSVRFNATDSNNAITGSFTVTNHYSRDCSSFHYVTVGQRFGLARVVRKGCIWYTRFISMTLLRSYSVHW